MCSVDPYLDELKVWYDTLPYVRYSDLSSAKGIIVTDMINGFTHEGPLASDRVAALVPGIERLCNIGWAKGTRLYVSLQDAHRKDALEFNSFPPHAVEGSKESKLIPELETLNLPWKVFEKNTLNVGAIYPAFNDSLLGWVQQRNPSASKEPNLCNINTFIVVGNCTDLCVYQAAMHIRQFANELHIPGIEVVVPAALVDTFDAPFHPGDLYHRMFLKHMEMNGIIIVKDID